MNFSKSAKKLFEFVTEVLVGALFDDPWMTHSDPAISLRTQES